MCWKLFGCGVLAIFFTYVYSASSNTVQSNTDSIVVDRCNGSAISTQVEICAEQGVPFEIKCNLPSNLVVLNFTKNALTMTANSSPNSVPLPHGTMSYSAEVIPNTLATVCTAGKVVINTTNYSDISSPFFCQDGPYPSEVQVIISIKVVQAQFNLTVEKECDRVYLSWSEPKTNGQMCTTAQFSVHIVNNVSKEEFIKITKESSITTDRLPPGVYNFFVIAEMGNGKTVKSVNTEILEINSLPYSTLTTGITVQPLENTSLSLSAEWEFTEPVEKVQVSLDNQTSVLLNVTNPMTYKEDIKAIPMTHTVTVVSYVEHTQAELQQCFSFDFDIPKEMTAITISPIITTEVSANIQINSLGLLVFNSLQLDPQQGVCNGGVSSDLVSCSDLIPDQNYVLLVNTTIILNNESNISFNLSISFQTSTHLLSSGTPNTITTSSPSTPSNVNGSVSSGAAIGIAVFDMFLFLTVAVAVI